MIFAPTLSPLRPARRAPWLVGAALLLAAACRDDVSRPIGPRAAPRRDVADTTRPAPADTGRPTGQRAEVTALFADAAPALWSAAAAARQAADSARDEDLQFLAFVDLATDSTIAPPTAWPTDSAADSVAARAARARGRARVSSRGRARRSEAVPPRDVIERTEVTAGGRSWAVETRAVSTPEFDRATATLRLTQEFTTSIVPVGAPGAAYRAEQRFAFDLPVCPAADGTSQGRLLATYASWQRTNAPAAGAADSTASDRRRTARVDGEVVLRVGDDAELAAVDLALNVGAGWDDGAGAPLVGGGRLDWPGAPPDALDQPYDAARVRETSDALGAIEALGFGPGDLYAIAAAAARAQVRAARALWRGGRCVAVEQTRGYTTRTVTPGTTVPLGPDAKSRMDGTTITSATLLARADGGSISPLAPMPHPATFDFTMPDAPATVEFRATSRRGIGTLRLLFVREVPDSANVTYVATSSYAIDQTAATEYDQAMTTRANGRMEVRSTLRFVFDRRVGDASYYQVYAVNRVRVWGEAGAAASRGPLTTRLTMALAGDDSSHTPRAATDARTANGRMIYPLGIAPTTSAGVLKVTRPRGNPAVVYELDLRVGHVAPTFEYAYRAALDCGSQGSSWHAETYDNVSLTTSVTGANAPNCRIFPGPDTRVDSVPYTWGTIWVDRSRGGPLPTSGALVSGEWLPSVIDPAGEERRTFTDCLTVTRSDPTQIGRLTTLWARPPLGIAFDRAASCRLDYTLRWRFPLP